MNEYELLYIISARVAADDVPDAVERVNALIRGSGGEVLSVDNWGRRRLAYPIRQYFEGTYVLTTLRLPPAGAGTLEAALTISEEIIRHLLIAGIIPPTAHGRGRPAEERERAPEPVPASERADARDAPELAAATAAE